jgi:surface antigen
MTRYLLLVLALVLPVPAAAINMNVFKDAPITRLTGEELKAFRATVMRTLDETPDGMTVEWRAPKTRFVSKITPQKSFTHDKLKCRDTVIESDAHDRFQRGVYTFCKGAKGEWGFKSIGAQPKSKKP